jgi:hypothetical protein
MSGMTIPISFNPHGLQPVGNLMWQDGNGDGVALSVFELVPDLPAPLEDLPRHPLTRVRLALGWFAANVRVDPQFRALPPFA